MLSIADVSDHNPGVDYSEPSIQGYIVKATESVDYANPLYGTQLANARQYQKLVGHYHYARPAHNTPTAEADWFLARLDRQPGEIVALDLEDGNGDVTAWALAWLEYIAHATGIVPWLYTYPDFAENHLSPDSRLARYPLWWASYNNAPLPVPLPWVDWTLWQFTGTGLDRSFFRGTPADWREMGGLTVDEATLLKNDVAALPISMGMLLREGVINVSAYGGGQAERIAAYEKGVFHRLNGHTVAMMRDVPGVPLSRPPNTPTYEYLFYTGKIVWY